MSPVTRRRAGGARRNARPESTGSGEDGALAREHKRSCRKMTSQPHQPKPPVHKKIATGQGRRARNPEKKQEQKVELLQAVPRAGGNHDQARRGRDTGLDLESWDLELEGDSSRPGLRRGEWRRTGGSFFRLFLLLLARAPTGHDRGDSRQSAAVRRG